MNYLTALGLSPGTVYDVHIKASDGQLESDWNGWFDGSEENVINTLPTNRAPSVPTNPVALNPTQTTATVSWGASTDPDGNAITYTIQWKTDAALFWPSENTATTSNTNYTITGLSPGTVYDVHIKASDGQLESDWNGWFDGSEENVITTLAVLQVAQLSWRSGNEIASHLITSISAGQEVFLRVDAPGMNNQKVDVEIWERDIGLTNLDDKIAVKTVTINNGVGFARWQAVWQGDDAASPFNRYYIQYDPPGPFNEKHSARDGDLSVSIVVGRGNSIVNPISYDWDAINLYADSPIDVELKRIGGAPISSDLPTWIVIHGRTDSARDMAALANAIDDSTENIQVMTLDWEAGAHETNLVDFTGEAWIKPVADWTAQALSDFGFTSTMLNLIGHSWGAVLAGELASFISGGVNRLVALDPAMDATPLASAASIGLGGVFGFGLAFLTGATGDMFYNTESTTMTFGDHSQSSWAFLSSFFGSPLSAATADDSFKMDLVGPAWATVAAHSSAVSAFTQMLIENGTSTPGKVSVLFALGNMNNDDVWKANRFSVKGVDGRVDEGFGSFEGVLQATETASSSNSNQWNINSFTYRNSTDQHVKYDNVQGLLSSEAIQLSWRSGNQPSSPLTTSISAGGTVYVRVDAPGMNNQAVNVEIWEQDSILDDYMQTITVLVQNGVGFGTWEASWQALDGSDPQNQYYAYFDGPLLDNVRSTSNLKVSVATDLSIPLAFDWDHIAPFEGIIDVSLAGVDGLTINPTIPTWVAVHGRTDSADKPQMKALASAVARQTGAQVLTLDWSEGAGAWLSENNLTDYSGEAWIRPVAEWAASLLSAVGFVTSNINLIGHSWGAVLSAEIASFFSGGVNTLVALDPADDAPAIGGTLYDPESVHFSANSGYSWAFLTSQFGSGSSVPTAHDSFVVDIQGDNWTLPSSHSHAKDMFTTMLNNSGPISNLFHLDRVNGESRVWKQDQYWVDPFTGIANQTVSPKHYEGILTFQERNGILTPISVGYVGLSNTVPKISNITDHTINEDGNTGAIAFSVADVETLGDLLMVTKHSSDLAILPVDNIIPGGSGSNRTVTVTPLSNQNGQVIITLTVTDGEGLSTSDSFLLTISPMNDAPMLSTISTFAGVVKNTQFTITYAMLANAANEADVDGDAIRFRISLVSSGTLTKNGVAVTTGDNGMLLGSGESLVWTPRTNVTGEINAFTVKAWDGLAHSSIAAQVNVNVVNVRESSIGKYVFYNKSAFDGQNGAATGEDDRAIAADKSPLLPGGTATFANYTSYSRGINGIIVDIPNLTGTPSAADFEFKVGNTEDLSQWITAPAALNFTTRLSSGTNGSGRITITWPDNAIQKQWLQVTVKATNVTGLAVPDVFYFGNAIGESGDSIANAFVNATDEIRGRNNQRSFLNPASVADPYDYNRDAKVDATDHIIARNSGTTFLTALRLLRAPTPGLNGLNGLLVLHDTLQNDSELILSAMRLTDFSWSLRPWDSERDSAVFSLLESPPSRYSQVLDQSEFLDNGKKSRPNHAAVNGNLSLSLCVLRSRITEAEMEMSGCSVSSHLQEAYMK